MSHFGKMMVKKVKLVPWGEDFRGHLFQSVVFCTQKRVKNKLHLQFLLKAGDSQFLDQLEQIPAYTAENRPMDFVFQKSLQSDGLWKSTCFELFLRLKGGPSYLEFNLNTEQRWNLYRFSNYREGMTAAKKVPPVKIHFHRSHGGEFLIELSLELKLIQKLFENLNLRWSDIELKPTMVMKTKSGEVFYLAPEHAEGKPDFHSSLGYEQIKG